MEKSGNVTVVEDGKSAVTIKHVKQYCETRTDVELENVCFDVSTSGAFQSIKHVLYEYRIAFLVGISDLLKTSIGRTCLLHYNNLNFAVVSLLSMAEIADIMDGREKVILLDMTSLKEKQFKQAFNFIKNMNNKGHEEIIGIIFTLSPSYYRIYKERLRSELIELDHMVIYLEDAEQKEFDVDTKQNILSKVNSEVTEQGRKGLSEQEIEFLCQERNPIFLECCRDFANLPRYDKDITQMFLQPIHRLVLEIMTIQSRYPEHYYVLVLVALCPQFTTKTDTIPLVMSAYMESIQHKITLVNIKEICEHYTGRYLREETFEFRYEMYRNAILVTVKNKEFLFKNCPLSFITDMAAALFDVRFYRNISTDDEELKPLARRFLLEMRNDSNSNLKNNKIWNLDKFKEIMESGDVESHDLNDKNKKVKVSRHESLMCELKKVKEDVIKIKEDVGNSTKQTAEIKVMIENIQMEITAQRNLSNQNVSNNNTIK